MARTAELSQVVSASGLYRSYSLATFAQNTAACAVLARE